LTISKLRDFYDHIFQGINCHVTLERSKSLISGYFGKLFTCYKHIYKHPRLLSVFIRYKTHAAGFIGSAVAFEVLNAGYRLRISVRRESQIPELKAQFLQDEDKVDFVIIPDITQESSFAGKLDGADYVLHIASPIHGDNKESYFGPAGEGTTAILKEAVKVDSIKRIVITSSIAALIPVTGVPEGGVIRGKKVHSAARQIS